jgi:hypothetical protein
MMNIAVDMTENGFELVETDVTPEETPEENPEDNAEENA